MAAMYDGDFHSSRNGQVEQVSKIRWSVIRFKQLLDHFGFLDSTMQLGQQKVEEQTRR
jgi:hypothetical protein